MILLSGKLLREQKIAEIRGYSDLSRLSFFLYGDIENSSVFYYLKGIKKSLDLFSIPYEERAYDRTLSPEENLNIFIERSKGKYTILARPLPHLESAFVDHIDPRYDPDMMSVMNIGKLYSGDLSHLPATASSVRYILDRYQIEIKGKRALILGRSLTVGKPIYQLLSSYQATVSVAHSKTDPSDLKELVKQSEIVVLATGKSKLIDRGWFNPNTILIDCGYNSDCGDLGFIPAEDEFKAYTPVPGGVGALTSLCLISNALTLEKSRK